MLTNEAANALLKTLEEPPPRLLFVLCTTDPQRLPSTVLSRCQHFALRRLRPAQIAGRLAEVAEREGFQLAPEAIEVLTDRAEGGLRDALALLDQVRAFAGDEIDRDAVLLALGGLGSADRAALVEALESGEARTVVSWMDRRWEEGADPRQVAASLRDLWHGWMLEAIGTGSHGPVASPSGWSVERLVSGVDRFMRVARDTRYTDDPRLALEIALVETVEETGFGISGTGGREGGRDTALGRQVEALSARVAELERALASRVGEVARPAAAHATARERSPRPTAGHASARTAGLATALPEARTGGEWDRLITRIRADHPRVAAILAEGRLGEVTEDEVHVRMPFEFHFLEIQRAENRALVEEALAVVYGGPRRLKVERTARAEAPKGG